MRHLNSTDVLMQELTQVLSAAQAHVEADMLANDANAGEYAAGLDYAMLSIKDLVIRPAPRLIRSVLDSPWCEKGSYADVIGNELLRRTEAQGACGRSKGVVKRYPLETRRPTVRVGGANIGNSEARNRRVFRVRDEKPAKRRSG